MKYLLIICLFEFAFLSINAQELNIGDASHGGIVFYVDSTGEHGLICAIYDQIQYSNWEDAKKACEDYTSGDKEVTYEDWRLPSIDEMQLIHNNKSIIDSTALTIDGNKLEADIGVYYWTSSPHKYGGISIISLGWMSGYKTWSNKDTNVHYARAVREF